MIKVIISGSRYANERKIVSSIFEERFGYGCCKLYDCNEEMTDINEVNKQEEINGFIRECDWFIFFGH